VTGFEVVADEVRLALAGGRAATVDLLVCAEGIGSATRRRLLPDVAPVYAGYVAWRGMVPERSLPAETAAALGDAITYYVYANSHILVYPIPGPDGSVVAGERLVNFVWYRNYLVGGDLDDVLVGSDGIRRELSLPPGAARADQVAELRSTAANRLPSVIADVVVGTEQPFAGRLRLATQVRAWSLASSPPRVDGIDLRELRMDLSVAYAPVPWLFLSVMAPLQARTVQDVSLASEGGWGLGDMEVGARFFLFRDREFSANHLVSACHRAELAIACHPPTVAPPVDNTGTDSGPGVADRPKQAGL